MSYAAILLTGPLIGAWADAHAAKKQLLSPPSVAWLSPHPSFVAGQVALAPLLIGVRTTSSAPARLDRGFSELADSRAMGRVSGWGWAPAISAASPHWALPFLPYIFRRRRTRAGAGHDADHRRVLRPADADLPFLKRAAAAAHPRSLGAGQETF